MAGAQQERIIVARVTSVDTNNMTCDCEPLTDNAPLLGCRLSIDTATQGALTIVPTVGTLVLLALADGNTAYVVQSDSAQVIINGGENGGMVIVQSLVNKINILEQQINTLKQQIASWSPVSQDGGSALKTALTQWATDTISETQVSDIENNQVKH